VSSHCVQIARRLGRATWAEIPAFAREREQVFVRAGVAADAGEAVLEDATRQELVGDLRDDRAPRAILAGKPLVVDRLQAVQMIRLQPKERRRLRTPGFVDATPRRRRRVRHARSGTEERRTYVRLSRGPSPFRCATGRFDATSVAGLTMLVAPKIAPLMRLPRIAPNPLRCGAADRSKRSLGYMVSRC